MSKSLSLKQQQLDEINIEIRKSILPALGNLITTVTNNLVDPIPINADLSGKTINQVNDIITTLRYETGCKIADEIRLELSKTLFAIVYPDVAHEQLIQEQQDERNEWKRAQLSK